MKKIFLLAVIILFCQQCSSQNTKQTQPPQLETVFSQIVDQAYFIGSWSNSQNYITSDNSKELQSQSECEKNSYWKFVMNNGTLKQSKFTAKGQDCSQYISTTYGKTSIKNNMMTYFVDDVNYTVNIKIISPTEFVVVTSDLIRGKMVSIEKIYTKK